MDDEDLKRAYILGLMQYREALDTYQQALATAQKCGTRQSGHQYLRVSEPHTVILGDIKRR